MNNINKLKLALLVLIAVVILVLISITLKSVFNIDPQSQMASIIGGAVFGGGTVLLFGLVNQGIKKRRFKWILKEHSTK